MHYRTKSQLRIYQQYDNGVNKLEERTESSLYSRAKLIFCLATLVASTVCPNSVAGGDECVVLDAAIPICSLLSDATRYDGKEIVVRALYRMVVHGSVLMGTGCAQSPVNLRGTLGSEDDKRAVAVIRSLTRKSRFQAVDVVVRGIFRVAQKEQCFGQDCLSYEISSAEFQCAMVPKAHR